MNEDAGFALVIGIVVLLLAGIICLTVWHNIDVQGRAQRVCIEAGGQWQNNTCVRMGH